jgi:hypothetical protein
MQPHGQHSLPTCIIVMMQMQMHVLGARPDGWVCNGHVVILEKTEKTESLCSNVVRWTPQSHKHAEQWYNIHKAYLGIATSEGLKGADGRRRQTSLYVLTQHLRNPAQ